MTDVRRQRIPFLWSRVRESMLAKGFSFNMGDAKCIVYFFILRNKHICTECSCQLCEKCCLVALLVENLHAF